jgi:phosphate transport system substrate-binding protein
MGMRVRRVLTAAMLAVAVSVTATGFATLHAAAGGPTVNGAGSTWVQIALDQWRADIAQQGYGIDYQGVGSSVGRQVFAANSVDFAASEIPYQGYEPHPNRAFSYLPDVAGGTSLMYNLHNQDGSRITTLRLNADAAARIFTGAMKSWQDSEIAALNPGMSIKETSVNPVVRSDGSGTSAQFSLYLANQAPSVWNGFSAANGCPAPCSNWPITNFQNQSGSDGVAHYVADPVTGPGAIGYVEYGYAKGYAFPVASLANASGNYTQPTPVAVATALQHAQFYGDNTQNLTAVYVAPEPEAYAMSSYSYLIVQTAGFDPVKGNVLGHWLIYIACGGQRESAPLGYSPIPPVLIQNVFDVEHKIPGAPPTPPIDRVNCPNPTVANVPGTPASGVPVSSYGGAHKSSGPSAAPSATADASASASTASADATAASTLGEKQKLASYLNAEKAAQNAAFGPRLAFLIAGICIVAGVIIPVLLGWRRRLPSGGDGGG